MPQRARLAALRDQHAAHRVDVVGVAAALVGDGDEERHERRQVAHPVVAAALELDAREVAGARPAPRP